MATRWWLCVCSLGILLLEPCALSEIFSLADSSHPVVGVFGRDVVLPCQLSPPARVPNMEVLWKKIDTGLTSVHEYLDEGRKDQPGQGYQTRTELFLQEFSRGNVSLKLKQLRVADAGKYQCLVKNPAWTQEAITELQVAAVAPVFIDVLGPRGEGIGLACRSAGWFPKPELQWVGKNQQKLATETATDVTQDRESLYRVVSHVTVTERENSGDISCIVRNGLVETQQQSAVHLSGDVFPQKSPWLAAFWVLFTLVLIAVGACAYLGYTAKRKVSQKKRSEEEALLTLVTEKKTLEGDCQNLQQLLDAKRLTLESECQELQQKLESRDKEKEDLQLECQRLREILDSQKKEKEKKQDKKKEEKKQEENKVKVEKQEENKKEEKQEKEEKKKEKEKKEKEKKEQEKREKEKKEQEKKKEEEKKELEKKKEEEKKELEKKKEEEKKKKEEGKKEKEKEKKKEEEKKKKEEEKKKKEEEKKKELEKKKEQEKKTKEK
ncbi:butyrophilin subfamily 3 member A2-like [Pelodiscus sinensis]|uniref:butyrophilin subfamily 3 member A2-like n=1 Tax=Pelodiscus sinensis TaxID=13735 RepID=UPI003F6CC875